MEPFLSCNEQAKIVAFESLVTTYDQVVGINTTEPILDDPRWSFINAMFFCCSLYTSIGALVSFCHLNENTTGFGGRLYPNTAAGRLVTMIYSFIGIPFMLAMTSDLGLVIFDGVIGVFLCALLKAQYVQASTTCGGTASNCAAKCAVAVARRALR